MKPKKQNTVEEEKFTLDEIETYISEVFDCLGYRRYSEMFDGEPELTFEQWELYRKLNDLFRNELHLPNLLNLIKIGKKSREEYLNIDQANSTSKY